MNRYIDKRIYLWGSKKNDGRMEKESEDLAYNLFRSEKDKYTNVATWLLFMR